jgi:hypothetical protein
VVFFGPSGKNTVNKIPPVWLLSKSSFINDMGFKIFSEFKQAVFPSGFPPKLYMHLSSPLYMP